MPPFHDLPDDARVWLFALEGDPTPLLGDVRAFCAAWTSHGRPVRAEAEVFAGRALVVAAVISPDEMNAGVSGCGIDAMQHAVETAAEAHGLTLTPALAVTLRDVGDGWTSAPRAAVRALAGMHMFGPDTSVLDLTPTTLGGLRAARGVERRAGDTWLATAFRLAA